MPADGDDAAVPADGDDLTLVSSGEVSIEGRLLEASNTTLYCTIELDGRSAHAVYKPVQGERPLWDFPHGSLAGREASSYLIASAVELGSIPPTVYRDGPLGAGMVQLWIEHSETEFVDVLAPEEVPAGWREVLRAQDPAGRPVALAHTDRDEVRELALLDVVLNNADRKAGHVIADTAGRVYGLDHGVCLHTEPKLRTVLWGWAGAEVPAGGVEKLRKLRAHLDGPLADRLAEHLTDAEIAAVDSRVAGLLETGVFPGPIDHTRSLPWPLF